MAKIIITTTHVRAVDQDGTIRLFSFPGELSTEDAIERAAGVLGR